MNDHPKHAWRAIATACLFAIGATCPASVWAQSVSTGGKLLLTGGVAQIEGAAGGGLTPWAVIVEQP